MPLLRARNLSKYFGGVPAVSDVSLEIGRGEIVGLIGPNGAGKTTLFDMLAGSVRPSGGEILLHERPVQHGAAHRRLGAGLGRTFQIPRPFPQMSVVENVMLARQLQAGERPLANWLRRGTVAREERAAFSRAMELLEFVTLAGLAAQPARVLSGGQRKLLELARVLMADPALVLLDEPAAGVNPALMAVIADRVRTLNAGGLTVLVIEHNMELVASLCGRVLVMAAGQVLCEGAPAEVARDPAVIEAYLGGGT